MKLIDSNCIPASAVAKPLLSAEIERYKKQIGSQWVITKEPHKLILNLEMNNFGEAINLVNEIAVLAEKEDHHPNLKVFNYKKLEVELFTHKIFGLHKNDFIMAAKIDVLVHNIQ